jgi:hypothetical protein
MMQPAWPSAIALSAATLLAAFALSGCDQSDAQTAAIPAAVRADESPPTVEAPSPPDAPRLPTTAVAASDPPASPEPTPPSPSPPQPRTPSAKPVDVTFDDIKLELEKDEPFVEKKRTDRLNELDGERVRIRGFILPGYQQSGLTQFVLVRDNMECCFGPGAALFDCIVVEMEGDATAEFSIRPVAVEGVFKVQQLKDIDGRQLAIYPLAGEVVR